MDNLELEIKNELKKLYVDISDDELNQTTDNLIEFYRLGLRIIQEKNSLKIPENNS